MNHLSPKYIKEKRKDKVEIIMMKVDIDQTVEIDTEDCYIEVDLSIDKIIEKGLSMFKIIEILAGNFRETQNYRGQNFRGRYRGSFRNSNFDRGRSRSRERQFLGNFRINNRSSSRSRSGSRANTNRDRIRCLKCRQYDHFAKDCPNMSQTEKDQTEQIQQILDSEEHKTTLKVLAPDTYEGLISTHSEETINHLNSWRVRMKPPHFAPETKFRWVSSIC